mgnify:CR=1 FL=1
MIIKFKIVSFRETDRIQKSIPMFFTTNGIKSGKEQSQKVWDYELTDEDGKIWEVYGKRKRGGFRKGQVIMTETQGVGSNHIGRLFNLVEFTNLIVRKIDRMKDTIKTNEAEIEQLRAL